MKRKFAAVMLSALAALLARAERLFRRVRGRHGERAGRTPNRAAKRAAKTGDEEQGDGEETQEPAYTLTYELTGDYYTVTGIESAAEAAEVVNPVLLSGRCPCALSRPMRSGGRRSLRKSRSRGALPRSGTMPFRTARRSPPSR